LADVKISGLPASTTPLAGTEVLPIVQGGQTRQVSVTNLTAGRSVSATNFIPSASTIPTNGMYLPAANTVGLAINSASAVTLNSTGLGIGVSPTVKLDVLGNTRIIQTNFVDPILNITQSAATTGNKCILNFSDGSGITAYMWAYGSAAGGSPSNSYALAFGANSAERMRIHASGGVSIGNNVDPGAAGLRVSGLIYPQQATTAAAPAYVKGAIYFDTTLNKLRVGGATAWETISSV
jgi:hypothetical protein